MVKWICGRRKPEPLVIEQKRKPSDETLARRIERETYRVTPRSIFARYDENTGKYEIKDMYLKMLHSNIIYQKNGIIIKVSLKLK